MSIVRRFHYKGDFTRIPNITADDRNLEADTLGVLVYLLAKADNWKVNVKNIRDRFRMGRNRAYAILAELEEAGYIQRSQGRNAEQQFVTGECLVSDISDTARTNAGTVVNMDGTPLPQNGDTASEPPEAIQAEPEDMPATKEAVSPKAVSRKRGHIIKNNNNNSSFGGADAPQGAQEEKGSRQASPSKPALLTGKIWATALSIMDDKDRACIGKWIKRVNDRTKGPETLLAIIETARNVGTRDPIPYITAALNKEFPPPPDPREFPRSRWELAAQAVPRTKHWPEEWGPRPGEAGCLMPKDLITPDLVRAISMRRVA